MFDLDRFIEQCYAALDEKTPERAAQEVVARAVEDPTAVMKAIGEPQKAGVSTLHRSDRLTVLNLVWGPEMHLMPHNHNMWASIGIYTGSELNTFWRRTPDGLQQLGGKEMGEKEAVWLGETAIHSVTNPLTRLTGALHVYGGDFFAPGRSEWDDETLKEAPYDSEKLVRLFEESNTRLDELKAAGAL
ncbi:hypothetical protein [Thalassobaculum sp.]|jgi:predicted metal-dependent enzyme (double-stranded beta helix superfamily)|uniref:hypothetical protein n=1 Tax=Thalassobaculum sp. TaxID=2022740 RepID=UPI003B58C561